ncbi:hypothetical protein D3C80_1181890 [compost metagenome]
MPRTSCMSGSTVHVKSRLLCFCVLLVSAAMPRFWNCLVMMNIFAIRWIKTTRTLRKKRLSKFTSVCVRANLRPLTMPRAFWLRVSLIQSAMTWLMLAVTRSTKNCISRIVCSISAWHSHWLMNPQEKSWRNPVKWLTAVCLMS